jgi:hypothetical protein
MVAVERRACVVFEQRPKPLRCRHGMRLGSPNVPPQHAADIRKIALFVGGRPVFPEFDDGTFPGSPRSTTGFGAAHHGERDHERQQEV